MRSLEQGAEYPGILLADFLESEEWYDLVEILRSPLARPIISTNRVSQTIRHIYPWIDKDTPKEELSSLLERPFLLADPPNTRWNAGARNISDVDTLQAEFLSSEAILELPEQSVANLVRVRDILGVASKLLTDADLKTPSLDSLEQAGIRQLYLDGQPLAYYSVWGANPTESQRDRDQRYTEISMTLLPLEITNRELRARSARNNELVARMKDDDMIGRPFSGINPESPSFNEHLLNDLLESDKEFEEEFTKLGIKPTDPIALFSDINHFRNHYGQDKYDAFDRTYNLVNDAIGAVIGNRGEITVQTFSFQYILNHVSLSKRDLEVPSIHQITDIRVFLNLLNDLNGIVPTGEYRKGYEDKMTEIAGAINSLYQIQARAIRAYADENKEGIKTLDDLLRVLEVPFGRSVTGSELAKIMAQGLGPGNTNQGTILEKLAKQEPVFWDDKLYNFNQELATNVALIAWRLGKIDETTKWLEDNISNTQTKEGLRKCTDNYKSQISSVTTLPNFLAFEGIINKYRAALGDKVDQLPTIKTLFSFIDAMSSASSSTLHDQPKENHEFWKRYCQMAEMWLPQILCLSLTRGDDVVNAYVRDFWKPNFKSIGLDMNQPYVWSPEIKDEKALNRYRRQVLTNTILAWSERRGLISQSQRAELGDLQFRNYKIPTIFQELDLPTAYHVANPWTEILLNQVNFPFENTNLTLGIWTEISADRKLMRQLIQAGGSPEINYRQYPGAKKLEYVFDSHDPYMFSRWFKDLSERAKSPNNPTIALLKNIGLDKLLWSNAGAVITAAAYNDVLTPDTIKQAGLDGDMERILYVLGLVQGLRYYASKANDKGIEMSYPTDSYKIAFKNYLPQHMVFNSLRSETEKQSIVGNDIQIVPGRPLVLIGSAGAGKSTLLKSLAMSGYIHKIGGFVFANQQGEMPDFQYAMLSLNDDIGYGSRFHHHVVRVATLIDKIYSFNNETPVLALMDEVFRGTEDNHATAIIRAVLDVLAEKKVFSVLATHYGQILDLNRNGSLPEVDIRSAVFGNYELTSPTSSNYHAVLENKGYSSEFVDAFKRLVAGESLEQGFLDEDSIINGGKAGTMTTEEILTDLNLMDKYGRVQSGFAGLSTPAFPWRKDNMKDPFFDWLGAPLNSGDRENVAQIRGDFIGLSGKDEAYGRKELIMWGEIIRDLLEDQYLTRSASPEKRMEDFERFQKVFKPLISGETILATHPITQAYLHHLRKAYTESSAPTDFSYENRQDIASTVIKSLRIGLEQIDYDGDFEIVKKYVSQLRNCPDRNFVGTMTKQIEDLVNLSFASEWLNKDELPSCRVKQGTDLSIAGGVYLGDEVIGRGYGYLRQDKIKEIVPNDIEIVRGVPAIATGDNESGKSFSAKMIMFNVFLGLCTDYALAKHMTLPSYEYIASTFKASESMDNNSSSMHEAMVTAQIIKNVQVAHKAGKRTLVIFDEPGSAVSSSEGAPFAALVMKALQKSGADIFATTHYHQMQTLLQKIDGGMQTTAYGYVYNNEGGESQFKAMKNQPPGTSRGVQRALDTVNAMAREGKLKNPEEVRAVFEKARNYLNE